MFMSVHIHYVNIRDGQGRAWAIGQRLWRAAWKRSRLKHLIDVG